MQLVERGLLDLDIPVGRYVLELKDVPVVIDSDETSVRTRPAKSVSIQSREYMLAKQTERL
jgi:CubicO group peptidase (beta-lactamase class C family)